MAYTNEQLGKALEDLTVAYNNFIEKAKEAAIVAMGDTVIAQIKQDAKNFIAAELAEQKTALEQAIEQAKIALKNSSNEAHVKLQQFSGEKQQELSALISNAETALSEMLKTAKIDYQDMADVENLKLTETAKGAKTAIEQSVNTANENLNKKGEEIIVKVKQEMTEHLDKLGASIEKKIEAEGEKILDSFKDGLNKITIATNKINESIKDFFNEFYYANSFDFLIIRSKRNVSSTDAKIKINSMGGRYCENVEGSTRLINNEVYNLSKIQKENRQSVCIQGKSIEYLYFRWTSLNDFTFEIDNFRSLKKIYWAGYMSSDDKIENHFKITNCPAFEGLELKQDILKD
ncbi:apolipoprotein A1/A4/E family protein [Treponema denticola]|uniref:hypothetical protein n=1 Tax=Treponema denticola TaxID=158 RepID=UPI004037C174